MGKLVDTQELEPSSILSRSIRMVLHLPPMAIRLPSIITSQRLRVEGLNRRGPPTNQKSGGVLSGNNATQLASPFHSSRSILLGHSLLAEPQARLSGKCTPC